MKRKVLLCLMLCVLSIMLFACGKTTEQRVEENMAERTRVYYFAECDDFYVTLSAGEREGEYLMNGKCEDRVKFALLSVRLAETSADDILSIDVKIDGEVEEKEMELNGLNGCYMLDLEREISGREVISVAFGDTNLTLQNLSKDFAVDSEKAIEIACGELGDRILEGRSGNNLNAECYLRVLDKKANNFDDFFWCFTVVNTQNENYSVVISTVDGSILAKSI
ncbi:MAG: hypothetical protein J6K39_01680 [Clostridia bacterium]|nr:hypothetical protein [Clostridia bacterium]